MGLIKINYDVTDVGHHKHLYLSPAMFRTFNVSTLGLGDVSKRGNHMDVLAAIYDLEEFTSFCSQIDPHLVVPKYLDQMLTWLFDEIATSFTKEYHQDKVILWGKFPFFTKFLGDGIMFLWDTKGLGPASLGNIVINLYKVCSAYTAKFLPDVKHDFVDAPPKLRCGIARGEVTVIGGGKDFVGPCINEAARLQKVSQLSFAFARKGFDPRDCFSNTWQAEFMLKRISIRGIAKDELIMICRKEFEQLPDSEKNLFREP